MPSSGLYAKGVAKREQILDTALQMVGKVGVDSTTIRGLASAVGLSPTGLMHYFTSKEQLLAEVLRRRDEKDATRAADRADSSSLTEQYLAITRHNVETPGILQLYTRLGADAIDPDHDAHEYFRDHFSTAREQIAAGLRLDQAAGRYPQGLNADMLATLIVAASDGLQSQWLYDPGVNMAEHLEYLLTLASRGETLGGGEELQR